MAMMQEQEWRALVQRWRQTLSEHREDIRGEYDPALDTYYLTIGAPRPAGLSSLRTCCCALTSKPAIWWASSSLMRVVS